jgi:RNA polymerase sigma-70 factor (ECF subfamily)
VEHYDLLFASALRVTKNKADAEDVIQRLWIKWLKDKTRPSPSTNLKGYLYKAAENEARNFVRSRNSLKEDDVFQELAKVPVAGPDGAHDAEREKLWKAIATLKPDVAAVLVLFYQEGYSAAEIAQKRGEKRTKIAMMIKRAQTQLQEVIAKGDL